MLAPGDKAPRISLPDIATGAPVEVDWADGPTVVAFFKTTCPVCQLVAPKVAQLAARGAKVVGIGQDPPAKLQAYAANHEQRVPTLSEAEPYEVSSAYGISSVPTMFLVDVDGTIDESVASWDRDRWNTLAQLVGVGLISDPSDGFPVFRPG
jgi:peroxiredoxin